VSLDEKMVRTLIAAESIHLLLSTAIVLFKLVPQALFLHLDGARAEFAGRVRNDFALRDWRRGAEAGDHIRQLASYSILSHIPRIKNVLPGLWSHLQAEILYWRVDCNRPAFRRALSVIPASLRVLAFFWLEVFATIIGLVGLQVKLDEVQAARKSWIPFVGFSNQITGIVDQEEVRMVGVLRLLFTGEDAEFGSSEVGAMRIFNGILLKGLCQEYGFCRGFFKYLSINSEDYQKLILFEEPTCISERLSVRARVRAARVERHRWWLHGAHRHMILGRMISAVDQFLWPGDSVAALRGNSF